MCVCVCVKIEIVLNNSQAHFSEPYFWYLTIKCDIDLGSRNQGVWLRKLTHNNVHYKYLFRDIRDKARTRKKNHILLTYDPKSGLALEVGCLVLHVNSTRWTSWKSAPARPATPARPLHPSRRPKYPQSPPAPDSESAPRRYWDRCPNSRAAVRWSFRREVSETVAAAP